MSNQLQTEAFGQSEFGDLDFSMLDVDHFEIVGDTSIVNNEMVVIEENLGLGSSMDRFISRNWMKKRQKFLISNFPIIHGSST